MTSAAWSLQTDVPQSVVELPPEQNLFLQVIAIAVNDYLGRATGAQNTRAPAQSAMQKSAEAWLFSSLHEEDFITVCRFAGVEPEFVREVAKRDRRLAWSRS